MAYTDRTIRIVFDGTQTNYNNPVTARGADKVERPVKDEFGNITYHMYANLGPDIWMVVRNPMLMPQSMLMPQTDVPVDDDGQPLDRAAALAAGREVCAPLVAEWNVYDPLDPSPNPTPFPVPATADMLDRVPAPILDALAELLTQARNPR